MKRMISVVLSLTVGIASASAFACGGNQASNEQRPPQAPNQSTQANNSPRPAPAPNGQQQQPQPGQGGSSGNSAQRGGSNTRT